MSEEIKPTEDSPKDNPKADDIQSKSQSQDDSQTGDNVKDTQTPDIQSIIEANKKLSEQVERLSSSISAKDKKSNEDATTLESLQSQINRSNLTSNLEKKLRSEQLPDYIKNTLGDELHSLDDESYEAAKSKYINIHDQAIAKKKTSDAASLNVQAPANTGGIDAHDMNNASNMEELEAAFNKS